MRSFANFVVLLLATAGSTVVAAPSAGPQMLPLPAATPAPTDTAYPGTLRLSVDATDIERRIFHVTETLPVAPGPLTLLYPQWLPGRHGPVGSVDKLAGLLIAASGKRIEWTRDPVNVFAFHLDVPAGVTSLDIVYDYVSATATNQERVVMTPEMVNLQWTMLTLYPAGHFTRRIMVAPSVTLPDGWQFGTALEVASTMGATTKFKPVAFDTLADSPMFAGRNFRRIELKAGARPVHMDVVADRPGQLAATDAQIGKFSAVVDQSNLLFGSQHYEHYDFLVGLSDTLGRIGLEHLQSTEIQVPPASFTEWDRYASRRNVFAHEFVHSWNGKFRRGADSWTPDFNTPMRNSLLWVYEGQTQYWGNVLSVRAGMVTLAQGLDALASDAANYDHRLGRRWRSLADTVYDPITAQRRPEPWRSWQRDQDYYSEGALVWLDVDTWLREHSQDTKSLDDFARSFFGVADGSHVELTYTFADVVAGLNAVVPNDWATFLNQRLESHGPGAPLDGLARGGYRLVYNDTPNDFAKSTDSVAKRSDFSWSLGLTLDTKDATLTNVQWDSPAFNAGLTVGTQIIAVDGTAFDADLLLEAVRAAKTGKAPIELIVKTGDRYRTVRIDYHEGLRYPHLARIPGTPARIDAILAARK